MKNSILTICLLGTMVCQAQQTINETIELQSATELSLEFKYATEIKVTGWDKNEIQLMAKVDLNNGESNEIYTIEVDRFDDDIRVQSNSREMEKHWKTFYTSGDCCRHGVRTDITIEVKLPSKLKLNVESISGNIISENLTGEMDFDTISGDITIHPREKKFYAKSVSGDVELLVKGAYDADFYAKTVSGEIFSNVDFEYLDGKKGLRQVVGQKVRGRINSGGEEWHLETVSGNIYMRAI
ncbi:MAG: DUF4097 family beta strand repeat-containing protein [Cyclobacteriaceae bacterium]